MSLFKALLQDRVGDLLHPAVRRKAAVIQRDRGISHDAGSLAYEVRSRDRRVPSLRSVMYDDRPPRPEAPTQFVRERAIDGHERDRIARPPAFAPREEPLEPAWSRRVGS